MQYPRHSCCRPARRDMRDALFFRVRICRNEGDCPWMNRRNDRAIIPWRGTRNFRNKEAGGAAIHNQTKLAYEVHLRVRNVRPREYALRENSVALVPSNETFNNFPWRSGRRRTYLRYYIENIQTVMFQRETTKCRRFVNWPYYADILPMIICITIIWNHLKFHKKELFTRIFYFISIATSWLFWHWNLSSETNFRRRYLRST